MLLKWSEINVLIIKQGSRIKGNTYPHCNFCWGFNNFNYQTNIHKKCSLNKQTKQIKLYTFHSASVYPWPLKSEHLIIFEDNYSAVNLPTWAWLLWAQLPKTELEETGWAWFLETMPTSPFAIHSPSISHCAIHLETVPTWSATSNHAHPSYCNTQAGVHGF